MKSINGITILILAAAGVIGCSSEPQSQQTQQTEQTQSQVQPQTEKALFDLATKAEIANRFEDAIGYYDQIIAEYPDSPGLDKALFMAGYIKYEYKKEPKQALENFNKVIEEYPNSDLVDDAEFMIKAINSGKDALTTFEETSSGN